MFIYSLISTLLLFCTTVDATHVMHTHKKVSDTMQRIHLTFSLEHEEFVYADHLHITSDNPDIAIISKTYEPEASALFSQEFNTQKKGWNTDFAVIVDVKSSKDASGALHLVYRTNKKEVQQKEAIPVHFSVEEKQQGYTVSSPTDEDSIHEKTHSQSAQKSFHKRLEDFFQNTNDPWLLIAFAFLMGLLASLTPCIYPMIPLTIGVLHNQTKGKKSVVYNFFVALCYAFGIAFTFALIGLITAFIGGQLGSLLANPWFVFIFVGILGYLAFSMMGFVHLNMPSFLQSSGSVQGRFGPCLSAFLFGAVSGPVASPCVSPALLLLLGKVAAFGSYIIGFGMLFVFGFGLSALLIVAGTFSSSLSMLPQSGQWMEDIKKFIGIMLLGMCVFYLANIASPFMVAALWVAFIWFVVWFLLWDAFKGGTGFMRMLKIVAACIALIFGVRWSMQAYTMFAGNKAVIASEQGVMWMYDIAQAQKKSQQEGKVLVYDFYGKACPMCKAIDKKIFSKDRVQSALEEYAVFLKVDGNTDQAAPYLEKFTIRGFPTIVVENSKGELLQQWASDLYSYTPEQFIDEVKGMAA